MALRHLSLAAALAFALTPLAARAEDGAETAPVEADTTLHPPVPKAMPVIPWPEGTPPSKTPVVVRVIVTVGVEGGVEDVKIEESGGAPFDRAVVEAVRGMRFEPARQGRRPIAVALPFTHTFEPPPPPVAPDAPQADALLEGTAVERGTRVPLANATVAALAEDGSETVVTTDAAGAFRLPVRSGQTLEVRVVAPEHVRFVQKERLAKDERLKVKYLVDRDSYGQYASVVRAERERTEVSRTTLSGRELTQVAGTFGDPYRVFSVLPGVTQVTSLLPLPVVRGSSPGNTGIMLDGVRLPLLFHLLAGPSVVHPEFIDRVDFYPGNFPVAYGGYTGGIVDGASRPARKDEHRTDIDLNLVQTGVFLRQPVESLGLTATAAGRIGYPGVLLSLVTPNAWLSYWDYQARVDGGTETRNWSVFLLGASDALKARDSADEPLQNVLTLTFHRLDLRFRNGPEQDHVTVRLVAGLEETLLGGKLSGTDSGDTTAGTLSLTPQLRWHRALLETLELNTGADATLRRLTNTGGPAEDNPTDLIRSASTVGALHNGGLFAEVVWKPADALRLIPGVRGDVFTQQGSVGGRTTRASVDPRFAVRYRLSDAEVGGTWLKAAAGRYHQPPRLFLNLPGVELSTLEPGLLTSTQVSAGAETRLSRGVELDVQGYFSWTDPVLFDLAVNPSTSQVLPGAPHTPPWEPPPETPSPAADVLAGLLTPRAGRSFGLELLLRKRDSTDRLFGWISYTLSRSERRTDAGFEPFDFDRLHILNVVAGVRLPRNWELGGRVLLQTGTPLTSIYGHNVERSDGQFRFDLRIDKRAVWNSWLLDFYVDVINTTVAAESGGLIGGQATRYLIPTIGFRGVL